MEDKKPVQFSAQIDTVRTLKDGGLKITIETQELPADEKAILFDFANKQIWALFKELPPRIEEIEVVEPDTEFKTDKTPSQRLRSVLFRYYEQNYSTKKTFEEFYREIMEKLINQYKEKLQ